MRKFLGGVSLAAALILVAPLAQAQTKLRVNGFGGASELPGYVAQDRGFFAKEGLDVEFGVTRGSVEQFEDMMSGKYEIASTLLDNIVAYAEGQGEAKLPEPSDIVGFIGTHRGLTSLVTKPEIKTIADIKGRLMGVDSASSGYSFVLFRILENNGLVLDRDYKILAVGGGRARTDNLIAGKIDGALLSAPADQFAKGKGNNILADAAASLGGYQGGVYAARRAWAKDHDKELVAFSKAIIASTKFIFEDKAGTIEVLRKRLPTVTEADAEVVYAALTGGPGGLDREARIDPAGVKTLLDLRSYYTKKSFTDPNKYSDLTWYNKAKK